LKIDKMNQPQNQNIKQPRRAKRTLVGFAATSELKTLCCKQGVFGTQPAETGFLDLFWR